MKRYFLIILVLGFFLSTPFVFGGECVHVNNGTLVDRVGGTIPPTGYDKWGYDYGQQRFKGTICSASRGEDPFCKPPYQTVEHMESSKQRMIWNDAFISTQDCDGDGMLDRHAGFDTYIGSGAWIMISLEGSYTEKGVTYRGKSSAKHIAAEPTDVLRDGKWYNSKGKYLGKKLWEYFIFTDTCLYEWTE
ncbi:MAG: hypothetical protein KAS02_02495 [Candidatus Pacebacteria bacterium]|nr:hypothetical protein [Candidatus Paceibacterota bacterium]